MSMNEEIEREGVSTCVCQYVGVCFFNIAITKCMLCVYRLIFKEILGTNSQGKATSTTIDT